MQLNITTDYAIRILVYLGSTNRLTTAKEISDKMFIPQNYIIKIMKKLKDADIVETYSGVKGGYKLKKNSDEINFLDIIEIMEKSIKIHRCLENNTCCSNNSIAGCAIQKYFKLIQNDLESNLKK